MTQLFAKMEEADSGEVTIDNTLQKQYTNSILNRTGVALWDEKIKRMQSLHCIGKK